MADVFTKHKRSEIMSRIRSKNTSVEKQVFRLLRSKNIYFQKHYKRAVGCPDIALPSKKKAVFIDGDFWHGWRFSATTSRLPEVYWKNKIANNIKRDRKNRTKLKQGGWKVLRIWEHEVKKDLATTVSKIESFLIKN